MKADRARYTFKTDAALQQAAAQFQTLGSKSALEIDLQAKTITTAAPEFAEIGARYAADVFLMKGGKTVGRPELISKPFAEEALPKPKRGSLFGEVEVRPQVKPWPEQKNIVSAPGVLKAGPVANTTVKSFSEYGRAEGLVIAWAGLVPGDKPVKSVLLPLIREVAKDDLAYVAVPPGQKAELSRELEGAGVRMENVRFIEAELDTVWMRDYGPVFVHTMDGELQIVDMVYNRPWPKDDQFPLRFSEQTGIPLRKTDFINPGGNFIPAGKTLFMTDVVMDPWQGKPGAKDYYVPALENYTTEKVAQFAKETFGFEKVEILRDMVDDGTGHIDMFVNKIDDRTFLVGEYQPGEDAGNGNREILDEAAAKLAQAKNDKGEQYRVLRLPMVPKTPGGPTPTYTNATTLNNKVLVPVYGLPQDEKALEVYRKAMPDKEIVPLDSRDVIADDGAVHCITQVVMRAPVGVGHVPPPIEAGKPTRLKFEFDTEKPLEKATVYWSTSPDGPFQSVELSRVAGNERQGDLSGQLPALEKGQSVYYFAHLEDEEGRSRTWPDKALRQGTAYRGDVG